MLMALLPEALQVEVLMQLHDYGMHVCRDSFKSQLLERWRLESRRERQEDRLPLSLTELRSEVEEAYLADVPFQKICSLQ